MRRTILTHVTLFVFTALAVGFSACSDDDDGPAGDAGGRLDQGVSVDQSAGGDQGAASDTGSADDQAVAVDQGVAADGPQSHDQGSVAATFSDVYNNVIKPGCSCHLGVSHVSGLAMPDKATAYANLVDVAAGTSACSGRKRVIANDAANSVLFQKVDQGSNLCGPGMPLGGAKLAQEKIDMIESWINAGAAND